LTEYVRRHQRRTCLIGGALVLSATSTIPFFEGMPWHAYWRSVGNPLLLLTLILWLVPLFEAGWMFITWQYLKGLRRAEWSHLKGTRRANPDAKK